MKVLSTETHRTLAVLSITLIFTFLLPTPEFMQISLLTPGQYEPLSRRSFRTGQ